MQTPLCSITLQNVVRQLSYHTSAATENTELSLGVDILDIKYMQIKMLPIHIQAKDIRRLDT
jgi:hypothetical protein